MAAAQSPTQSLTLDTAIPITETAAAAAATPAALLVTTAAHPKRHAWLWVAGAAFAVAWGGNDFTPLLVMYRQLDGLSASVVDILLGAYVLGVVPALLLGGPLSDRWGRRPLMLPAPLLALCGSAILALGAHSTALLFVGRVFSGLSVGLVMAAGSSWIKELSSAPFDPRATSGTGARRAALSVTAGFGLGAGAAAALAQFGPLPAVTPYFVAIAVTIVLGLPMIGAPETRTSGRSRGPLIDDLKVPAAKHKRFLYVVVPMAPWVFATAATAYAIVPGLLLKQVPGAAIGYSGLLCLVALGSGVAIQALGRRIDDPGSARAVVVGLAVTVPGMALALLAVATQSLWLSFAAAAVLGAAYGLLMVSGLQEIQRIARPDDLAGLTAVYYSLTYIGFFVPAVMAALSAWFSYPAMLAAAAVIAALALLLVALNWRRHL
jgi:MFS family permease